MLSVHRLDTRNQEAWLEALAKEHATTRRETDIEERAPSNRAHPVSKSAHIPSKRVSPRRTQFKSARKGCVRDRNSMHAPEVLGTCRCKGCYARPQEGVERALPFAHAQLCASLSVSYSTLHSMFALFGSGYFSISIKSLLEEKLREEKENKRWRDK